jgi:hypothetical protein
MNQDRMSEALNRAILETLLPGEGDLPGAQAAGLNAQKSATPMAPLRAAIARIAGSDEAFIDGSQTRRAAILQAVQAELLDEFTRLLAALLPDYYEAPPVIRAFGWTERPPQPDGHSIPAMDAATSVRLEKVRLRRKIWRDEA